MLEFASGEDHTLAAKPQVETFTLFTVNDAVPELNETAELVIEMVGPSGAQLGVDAA